MYTFIIFVSIFNVKIKLFKLQHHYGIYPRSHKIDHVFISSWPQADNKRVFIWVLIHRVDHRRYSMPSHMVDQIIISFLPYPSKGTWICCWIQAQNSSIYIYTFTWVRCVLARTIYVCVSPMQMAWKGYKMKFDFYQPIFIASTFSEPFRLENTLGGRVWFGHNERCWRVDNEK